MNEEYSMVQAQMSQQILGLERQLREQQTEREQLMRQTLKDGLCRERNGVLRSAVLCVLCMPFLWFFLLLYGTPLWMVLFTLIGLAVAVLVEGLGACRLAAMDVLKANLDEVEARLVCYRRFVNRWYLGAVFPFLLVWVSCFLSLLVKNPLRMTGACIGAFVGVVFGVLLFHYTRMRIDGFIRETGAIRGKGAGG